ncbi:Pectinesterase catalytic [Arabidopsis thaliana x Arabidopsis arenosa]|uniref:Pectinesterase n=1 Tax=Arabidopsis thaliana x Arabidopsis arenosa TaxID=1240361 RepID=A0A8T2C5W1_9BRAS|nr:Pectinesterase catalytic [Arabidopsis thaliana x Arabidopsis arenosa]
MEIQLSVFILSLIPFFALASSTSDVIEMVVPSEDFPSWLTDFNPTKTLRGHADLIVSQDGTGDYKTINEAVAAAPTGSKTRFIIYVKRGTYKEIVHIGELKTHLTIVGDGSDATIITGSLNSKDGTKTFNSSTVAIDGDWFMAQDLWIQNTAGPAKGPAVALRVSGDAVVIYRCRIDAYQDTLYAHSNRQFYRDCFITGTVDFICGRALAVFQNCQIEARKPTEGQSNVITAQQKRDKDDTNSGFSIQNCSITASADLAPFKRMVKTYLGRPWGDFSTVVFMECYMDDMIDASGWTPWNSSTTGRLSTLFYGEYRNKGPGANTSQRVDWKGFKVITDPIEAGKFTVGEFLNGDSWLNATGVPFYEGL